MMSEPTTSTMEDRLTIHSVHTTEEVRGYCSAALRANFYMVEEGIEADLLQGLLKAFPDLLPVVSDIEWAARLNRLGQAFQLNDWRVGAQNEMLLAGRSEIIRFLQTVPLLSEEEVRNRIPVDLDIDWTALMKVSCAGTTLYFADQFDESGAVHPECIEVHRILKKTPGNSDWDIALWWISSSGWLDGCSPRDIYKEDCEALYDAAEQEVADNVG